METIKNIFQEVYKGNLSIEDALFYLEREDSDDMDVQNIDGVEYDLSKGQEALWAVHQFDPMNYAYNCPVAFHVRDKIDREALKKSVGKLIKRNSCLRTAVYNENEKAVQKIMPPLQEERWFQVYFMKGSTKEELLHKVKEESRRSFQITEGNVFRVTLFECSADECIMLLNFHHMMFDGISLSLFVQELQESYIAERNNREVILQEPSATYQDFVLWQQGMLEREGGIHKKYWLDKLSGELPLLELPVDRTRPAVPGYQGSSFAVELEEDIILKLRQLAVSKNTTLFTLMLTAYQVFLHRTSGQDDIIIGTPSSGRSKKEFEHVMGYFMNIIPIRSNLSGNPVFTDVMNQVQNTFLEAFDHADYPYYQVITDLKQKKRLSGQLIQAAFYFQNWIEDAKENLAGTREENPLFMEILDEIHQEGEFDFVLEVFESKNGCKLYFKYNTDIFLEETIIHIADHFIELLAGIVENPERRIGEYSMLTKEESWLLLEKWNDTYCEYPKERGVYELFQDQVKDRADFPAVIFEEKTVSYRELYQEVNRLASHLIKEGVGPGSFVGIFMERSEEMVTALLGVLRAGGAYIPLDPEYPMDRLSYMFEDSGLSVILTQSSIESKLPDINAKIIRIHEVLSQEIEPMEPVAAPSPEDLAYIIYTSGSTGKPKGVEVTRMGLTNFLLSMTKQPGFTVKDHLLAVTTICFDIAGLEMFLPLICGGILEVARAELSKDAIKLRERLDRGDITVLQATPATWQMLIAAEWIQGNHLKVLCGGEALSRELADKLLHLTDDVWNLFGPTETTIWSSVCKVKPNEKITIGKPIANTQFYVLDEMHNPSPIGIPGELYIGGDGLARGYHDRPDETNDKFIRNGFHEEVSQRIYKTGDLVKYLPDGSIEYLSRIDFQVKVRGYRIELGEIESVIVKRKGIREAAVVYREITQGNKQLVCFLISDAGSEEIDRKEFSAKLKKWLPDYMIPVKFVTLNSYPMTLNKKVDRKALASLSFADLAQRYGEKVQKHVETVRQEQKKTLPECLEHDIKTIVQNIIGSAEEGVQCDAFLGEYGFDSVRFTSLSMALRKEFEIEVSPAIFFEYDTIAKIAEFYVKNHEAKMSGYYKDISNVSSENIKLVDAKDDNDEAFAAEENETEEKGQVAVIGISGIMPDCEDLDEFWRKLESGDSMVSEIPQKRWNWCNYYGDPFLEKNKTNSKWGSFVKDVDKFDALFFGISPREAQLMDPQQRLFLETAYHAIEDSGYKPSDFSGTKMGVFVGVTACDYSDVMAESNIPIDGYTASGIARPIVANRISYLLNFKGPSMAIDTACSSSLVSIHESIKAIEKGDCTTAIAGGVNLLLSPLPYIALSKNGMLSPNGKCNVFDQSANGYVRGEGVCALLLKSLKKAEADKDHIYAVIKGSAQNHGGRSNSLTAPNTNAQSELLIEAYKNAGVDPSTVSYIEAHGTGTKIGDPIEINSLKKAFHELYAFHGKEEKETEKTCGLGSLKANAGHLEAAAGAAGALKVILAMKYGRIPANPNLSVANPYIDLEGSPFYLMKETKDWERAKDDNGQEIPRRAGLSSFGFGGTNVHVVFEEYRRNEDVKEMSNVVILSARNKDRLKTYAHDLLKFLKEHQGEAGYHIMNVSYTLQFGREEMQERIAIVVSSMKELFEYLEHYVDTGIHRNTSHHSELKELADNWMNKNAVDWTPLYRGQKPQRVPLPTYPFAKEAYWILKEKLHPLVNENCSTAEEQSFKTTITGEETLLLDHVAGGRMVLPGTAYIEMARAAGDLSHTTKKVHKLKNIVWVRPVIAGGNPIELKINLLQMDNFTKFVVNTIGENSDGILNAQGNVIYGDGEEKVIGTIDIDEIKERCTIHKTGTECYEKFRSFEFQYGESFQVIKELYGNGREVLSCLELVDETDEEQEGYVLYPTLIDGAIQSVIGLSGEEEGSFEGVSMPYSIGELTIYEKLQKQCYVHLVLNEEKKKGSGIRSFDIDITDMQGRILVTIRDYITRLNKNIPQTGTVKKQKTDDEMLKILKLLESGGIDAATADKMMEEMQGGEGEYE